MRKNDRGLAGRVAIVTGAGAGIGVGIAAALADAGAAVAVADIDEANAASSARTIVDKGGQAVAVRADVSDARQVDAMVQKTGRIIVFLCSEAADALCGLAIDVDGGSLLGWTPWEQYMAKRRRK
jgi:NADP-dependent 3-hydroxy acid dehydrogenase YdfG